MKLLKRIGLYGQRASGGGLGKFASQIAEDLSGKDQFEVCLLDATPDNSSGLDLVLYASRSGRMLQTAATLCEEQNIHLWVLSTGLEEELKKVKGNCEIKVIPNTSVDVINYKTGVVNFWASHKDWSIRITEYHQQSKADVSGTAIDIAQAIDLPVSQIISIRNDQVAESDFGISLSAVGGYAIHNIEFTSPEDDMKQGFEIRVIGRATYTRGLVMLINEKFKKYPKIA